MMVEVAIDLCVLSICLSSIHLARTLFLLYSCLIARNLMNGQKTCLEVFQYMNHSENKLSTRIGDGVDCMLEGGSKGDEIAVSIFYCFSVYFETQKMAFRSHFFDIPAFRYPRKMNLKENTCFG